MFKAVKQRARKAYEAAFPTKVMRWKKSIRSSGNVHLPSSTAILSNLPYNNAQAYIRPSDSDIARVEEYGCKIYHETSYLHAAVVRSKPRAIIDFGANIGLSTLCLLQAFPTVKSVFAVEAEAENYGVLQKNFVLWNQKFPNVVFRSFHAVAVGKAGLPVASAPSLCQLTGNNSASGTFRFKTSDGPESVLPQLTTITPGDIVSSVDGECNLVVKVDIEGGEDSLFSYHTSWLERVLFLTAEIHDRYHPDLFNSSRSLIRAVHTHDFAVWPKSDLIHCYNRSGLNSGIS